MSQKTIIIGLCIVLLVLTGCNSSHKELMEMLQEEDVRLDAKYERMQEEWNLRDATDSDCVFDNCLKNCDTSLSIDMMDYDHNENGELDNFEYEVMESSTDRKSKCFHNCLDNDWKYMDECR